LPQPKLGGTGQFLRVRSATLVSLGRADVLAWFPRHSAISLDAALWDKICPDETQSSVARDLPFDENLGVSYLQCGAGLDEDTPEDRGRTGQMNLASVFDNQVAENISLTFECCSWFLGDGWGRQRASPQRL
jgi:hypothetical protein